MGDELKLLMGPVSVGAAGTHPFIFKHDVKAKASMIDCIQAEILSGTQTGVVTVRWGNAEDMTRTIHNDALTAAEPFTAINPKRVLYPGQVITISFASVTAGDVVQASIGGH